MIGKKMLNLLVVSCADLQQKQRNYKYVFFNDALFKCLCELILHIYNQIFIAFISLTGFSAPQNDFFEC